MSQIILCSDLHLGHKNITKFRQFYGISLANEQEHREWILHELSKVANKRVRFIMAGDIAFTQDALDDLGKLPGEKILIRGNHDELPTAEFSKVFSEIYGLLRYKQYWISHPPIHPDELRGRLNLHGHVHGETLSDTRYFNLCPENLQPIFGRPWAALEEIRHLRPPHVYAR
jgi:calcineurin-like phosphoesterase family protein